MSKSNVHMSDMPLGISCGQPAAGSGDDGRKGWAAPPLTHAATTLPFQQTARFKRTSALHGRDRVRPAVDHLLPLIEYWGTAGDDKYLLITEDSIMDTVNQHPEVDDRLDAQRDIIRQSIKKSPTISAWQCATSV